MSKSWSAELVFHKESCFIAVRFPKDRAKINRFRKKFPIAIWSRSLVAWLIPDSVEHRAVFGINPVLQVYSSILGTSIKPKVLLPSNYEALCSYHQHLVLKAYSASTIKTYQGEFLRFLELLKTVPVQSISREKYASYLVYLRKECGYTESSLHGTINALKFYVEQILGESKLFDQIPRPKKKEQLPHILAKGELRRLFDAIDNKKHKLILMTAYSAGLRVSEVVSLQIKDIDSERMQLFIRQGKGKKDRVVALSEVLLFALRDYVKEFRPKTYLFEGQDGGAYSVRSVQAIMKKAKEKAKILKLGSTHSLRHAYATHLLDAGTDVRFIQELLGHNDLKTTMLYTHVTTRSKTKVKSPLDDF